MIHRIFFSMLCCLALLGCGRKQRTIFQFNEQNTTHISKLALPAVQGLQVQRNQINHTVTLTWQPLSTPIKYNHPDAYPVKLLGYHVFKLSQNSFIPKKPLNKQPITETLFIDTKEAKTKKCSCYIVRPVFNIQHQIIVGVSSRIVCTGE